MIYFISKTSVCGQPLLVSGHCGTFVQDVCGIRKAETAVAAVERDLAVTVVGGASGLFKYHQRCRGTLCLQGRPGVEALL